MRHFYKSLHWCAATVIGQYRHWKLEKFIHIKHIKDMVLIWLLCFDFVLHRHVKSLLKVDKNSIFWLLMSNSWCHNAGAWKLSGDHTLHCMTNLPLHGSGLSAVLFGNGNDSCHNMKFYWQKYTLTHPLKNVSLFFIECIKNTSRVKISWNRCPFFLSSLFLLTCTFIKTSQEGFVSCNQPNELF